MSLIPEAYGTIYPTIITSGSAPVVNEPASAIGGLLNTLQDYRNPVVPWWGKDDEATKQISITSTGIYSLSDILGTSSGRAKVFIEACGGGGGGSGAGTTIGGGNLGGGGGGSGYIQTFESIFPADYQFSIMVGVGGAGGPKGSSGSAGTSTIVQNVLFTGRVGVPNLSTVLLAVGPGQGAIGAQGGAGQYGGGGGSANNQGPVPGGPGGVSGVNSPAWDGQRGDASQGNGGTGAAGSGAGVGGAGNYGYSDNPQYGSGGGGGGIQSASEGHGGSGDAYGPPTIGAPGCGGGGCAVDNAGFPWHAGANGGSGYVQITAVPIPN